MHRRTSARGPRARQLIAGAAIAGLVGLTLPYVSVSSAGAAPAPDGVWSSVDRIPRPASADGNRRVDPSEYEAYTLDQGAMSDLLADAPNARTAGSSQVISIPAPNGDLVEFAVRESPVMQKRLAAKHPEIRTYAGRGVEDPSATIRLDLTPMGLHASVRGDARQDAWYIDPAYNSRKASGRVYLSYLGTSLPSEDRKVAADDVEGVAHRLAPAIERRAKSSDVSKRTYRLALLTDPSYARYFGTENVLAEKVTLINRVNQIYNDDFAIRLMLVNGTEKLNLDTKAKAVKRNGPCGTARCFEPYELETCSGGTLERNGAVLGQLIGAGKYDIGHVALGVNGGGIAGLGVVGGARKAVGCTGLPTPEGDFYAIDYVAHEMGHQFGANHTFDGAKGACSGGNRNPGTSVEPGSGSSVMAYAGICDTDDLQPHTDPYFSQRSIDEVTAYTSGKRRRLNEMQTVSLRDFDRANDAFKLRINGKTTTQIKHGSSYGPAKIKKRLEAILGKGTVRIGGWGGVENFADLGFSVTFIGKRAGKNQRPLKVIPVGDDMSGFVGETRRGGLTGNRGAVSDTGNHTPEVKAPANKRIPLRTPFTLKATGSDPDSDAITYSWEQNDRGGANGTALMNPVRKHGPLFRIFGQYANVTPAGTLEYNSPGENHTSGDPTRTFPDLRQVVRGNTNAATGTCPKSGGRRKTACHSEWLPTRDYVGRKSAALHFRVTARDHAADGGGTAYDDVTLTLARKAGPLLVTSYDEPGEAVRGTRTQQITWAVNGTNKKALAKRVRVMLSTDGGKTFDTVLKKSTTNNGKAYVTWPNVNTKKARIKVEAIGNYFFAVNAADFTISAVD